MRHFIFLVCFLGLTLWSSCGGDDGTPDPEIVLQGESTHYNYYHRDDDRVDLDTDWMEAHYDWMTGILEVTPTQKLNYYKYRDRAHLQSVTGMNTNGFAEIGTWDFHSIWHPEGHENVHTVVINMIGHPPALFNEGIAVALAPQPIYGKGVFVNIPTWNGESLDLISLRLKNGNALPPLENLLESTSFFSFDTGNTYPMAGSFCKYLMAQFSMEQIKTFIGNLNFRSSAAETTAAFELAFGQSLETVWNAWVDQL